LPLGVHVFHNPNAAYFPSTPGSSTERVITSASSVGIENSRRFRALPVYASLAAYGKAGYMGILERQIELARAIATIILESDSYELLPVEDQHLLNAQRLERVFMIVMFRAKDTAANETLTQRIKDTRIIYVSPTQWDGLPATRFAVANWQVDVEKDLAVIKEVLSKVSTS
jgi:glutamate/tyrosine decarboxylase-like PLP-dependent enzyme